MRLDCSLLFSLQHLAFPLSGCISPVWLSMAFYCSWRYKILFKDNNAVFCFFLSELLLDDGSLVISRTDNKTRLSNSSAIKNWLPQLTFLMSKMQMLWVFLQIQTWLFLPAFPPFLLLFPSHSPSSFLLFFSLLFFPQENEKTPLNGGSICYFFFLFLSLLPPLHLLLFPSFPVSKLMWTTNSLHGATFYIHHLLPVISDYKTTKVSALWVLTNLKRLARDISSAGCGITINTSSVITSSVPWFYCTQCGHINTLQNSIELYISIFLSIKSLKSGVIEIK